VDRASLARALDETRERGYALDDEEYDDGVRCVAVAVGPIGAPIRRDLDLKILDPQKAEPAAKGNVRQVIKLRRGINDELSKEAAETDPG